MKRRAERLLKDFNEALKATREHQQIHTSTQAKLYALLSEVDYDESKLSREQREEIDSLRQQLRDEKQAMRDAVGELHVRHPWIKIE